MGECSPVTKSGYKEKNIRKLFADAKAEVCLF
jgi:hypothetical protein